MKRETNSPRVPATVEMAQEDLLLTTKQAAEFLAMSWETLKDWRHHPARAGPNFIKAGRYLRYSMFELREWLKERTVSLGVNSK